MSVPRFALGVLIFAGWLASETHVISPVVLLNPLGVNFQQKIKTLTENKIN